jgi:hypothetical protein
MAALTALMAAQAGAQAAGALTRGVGGALAARQMFTREDRERLEELERLEREGALGATEQELARVEGLGASLRGATLRQQEAQSAREAAMMGAVSGRDIFLREQAQAQAGLEADEAIRTAMTEADVAARAAQEAEIKALRDARAGRRAATVEALTGAGAGALEAGAAIAQQEAQREFEREQQLADLEAAPTTDELIRALMSGQQGAPYGGRAG